jgi:hypothetical protein
MPQEGCPGLLQEPSEGGWPVAQPLTNAPLLAALVIRTGGPTGAAAGRGATDSAAGTIVTNTLLLTMIPSPLSDVGYTLDSRTHDI